MQHIAIILEGPLRGSAKKVHQMANQIPFQPQSPFFDICWLHMTLTNKGFQNGCWLMEDMVHTWSAMTD